MREQHMPMPCGWQECRLLEAQQVWLEQNVQEVVRGQTLYGQRP